MTQEINISKILEEFDEMGGCFAAISKDSILHAYSARGWLKGRLIELLDAIPCDTIIAFNIGRINKDGDCFGCGRFLDDCQCNGINQARLETKSIIEQLKR